MRTCLKSTAALLAITALAASCAPHAQGSANPAAAGPAPATVTAALLDEAAYLDGVTVQLDAFTREATTDGVPIIQFGLSLHNDSASSVDLTFMAVGCILDGHRYPPATDETLMLQPLGRPTVEAGHRLYTYYGCPLPTGAQTLTIAVMLNDTDQRPTAYLTGNIPTEHQPSPVRSNP